MKISVAIATFNGAKYIEKQISSILEQSVPVDELIISDDGSTDSTIDIIKSFNDARIKVLYNNGLHGYRSNFENALNHTNGDIVFLADQDDIWLPSKVSKVKKVFEENHDAMLVFSNGNVIDENDVQLSGKLIDDYIPEHEIDKLSQTRYLEQSISNCLANGMTICISKKLLSEALPMPDMKGCHDHWLLFYSMVLNGCYFINEQLVSYRVHGGNLTGAGIRKRSLSEKIGHIKALIKTDSAKNNDSFILANAAKEVIQKKNINDQKALSTAEKIIAIGKEKEKAYTNGGIKGVVILARLYRNNFRYRSTGKKSFIRDLLGCFLP